MGQDSDITPTGGHGVALCSSVQATESIPPFLHTTTTTTTTTCQLKESQYLPRDSQELNDSLSESGSSNRYSSSSYSSSSCASSSSSTSNVHTDNETNTIVTSISSPTLSTTSKRPFNRQTSYSNIILIHPAITSPSNAKRLEDFQNVTVVYNPKSGNKRGEKVMLKAVKKFKDQGLNVTTIALQYANHATEICMSRVDFEDIDILCVVGGDGTFHEVVNGLMHNPIARLTPEALPALSVIPAGTGNSMVRELQGISSVRLSTDEVLFGMTVPIDILKITTLSVQTNPPKNTVPAFPVSLEKNRKVSCDEIMQEEQKYLAQVVGGKSFVKKEVIYAFNSIHWGLASRILEKAEKMRWMGHGIRYTAATLMELMSGTSTNARIILEDANGKITDYKNDSFCLLIANNIGTAGKGMKMAPKAKINDGLIDVLLIRSHKPWHLMKIFEKVYNGTHVDLPYVEYKQVRKFSIIPFKKESGEVETQADPEFAEELVDIDGELKGCTPFECEVIPHALELIV